MTDRSSSGPGAKPRGDGAAGLPSGETGSRDTEGAASAGAQSRPLSDAARRALAEAEERRRKAPAEAGPGGSGGQGGPKEIGGRDGPEPVRYGDWEVNGIATDF